MKYFKDELSLKELTDIEFGIEKYLIVTSELHLFSSGEKSTKSFTAKDILEALKTMTENNYSILEVIFLDKEKKHYYLTNDIDKQFREFFPKKTDKDIFIEKVEKEIQNLINEIELLKGNKENSNKKFGNEKLTSREAAEFLGVSIDEIYKGRYKENLPFIKGFHGHLFFKKTDLISWKNNRERFIND